ncbi:MAG: GNAT family N-acetyltransferase [Dehalococcoidia bacterium]
MELMPIAPAKREQVAEMLARAFFDDPLMMYVQPDSERRRRGDHFFFLRVIAYCDRYGVANTFASAPEGAALWLPPDAPTTSTLRMVRSGMAALPFAMGFGAAMRFMTAGNYLESLHHRNMPPRHWYLLVLGIEPERQGMGLGGAIIQPTLERADRERLPCYLETMKERNVTFYRKHGFDVVVEGELPKGGPHFWTMRREPIG